MFYTAFGFNKKGPLARCWLAAHFEKKLTKTMIFETNIHDAVEAILNSKDQMALRTSGHLMLGVVRIYSRKALHLLADCNDTSSKIKPFRPDAVDLPEVNQHVAFASVTLLEDFQDFETTLANLENNLIQTEFSANQSRQDEITMREDLGSITLMDADEDNDDNFGDIDQDFLGILGLFEDAPDVSGLALPQEASDAAPASLKQGILGLFEDAPDVSGLALPQEASDAAPASPKQGMERKRKKKHIVDTQIQIPKETIKKQLSDTSDIVTVMDMAPPTKEFMLWKERGNVDKMFQLPGRPISKTNSKLFTRNLKQVPANYVPGTSDAAHLVTDDMREADATLSDNLLLELPILSSQPLMGQIPDQPAEILQPKIVNSKNPHVSDGLSSVAPSVPPAKASNVFDECEAEQIPVSDLQEEAIRNTRAQQMQHFFEGAFTTAETLSFKHLIRNNNRKQAAASFYTLLTLQKQQIITSEQSEPYSDIMLSKGPNFGSMN